jgi:anti-sigma B factor antagonist
VTNLEVTARTVDDTAVVSLSGELDISVVGQLEQELMAVEQRSPATLLLDLRGLSFIDSSGLRLVLEADLRARKEARRFALVKGPDAVHRVFLIALLDKRLDFVDPPSEPEAEGP